jgi:putative transposase
MQTLFLKGHYYHIYNRGIDGRNIFFSPANCIHLLKTIKITINRYGVDLVAYCLMPNHYHFLARQQTEQPLSEWIRYIFNGYSQIFNRQHRRRGTLFQGRAKHVLVDKEKYLLHLMRYIHYNPVAAKLASKPEQWLFSNYLECIGARYGSLYNPELIEAYFQKPSEYKKFMNDYYIEKHLAESLQPYLLEK